MAETTMYLSPNGQDRTEARDPANRLVVATVEGVLTLSRADIHAPWNLTQHSLTDRHVGQLVFDPMSGRLFAGAHVDGGLWVSEDAKCESWRQLSQGLTEPHLYALALRRDGDATCLLAGTSPAALFRSDDLGESWTEFTNIFTLPDIDKWTFPPPPHIPHIKHIVFHPGQPKTIFFCVEQGGLFRSTDDGGSWAELPSYSRADDLAYRDIHRLLINPADHNEFYLATGEGLYRSVDAGTSWTHVLTRKDEVSYPDFLQFDPADNKTIYVAGAARSPGGWYKEKRADSGIMTSADDGHTWKKLDNGLPKPMIPAFQAMSLHVWAGGITLVIGTATGEVYVSEDRGASWQCAMAGLPPIAKDEHHLPFLGRPAGSKQASRSGWAYRKAQAPT